MKDKELKKQENCSRAKKEQEAEAEWLRLKEEQQRVEYEKNKKVLK